MSKRPSSSFNDPGYFYSQRKLLKIFAITSGVLVLGMILMIWQDFDRAWDEVDVILTPTTPTPAFAQGEKAGDPIAMYLEDILTVTVNMAGLPGISIPAGLSAQGTPLGLQLIAKPFDEPMLFRCGQIIEEAAGCFAIEDRWWQYVKQTRQRPMGERDAKQATG